VVFAGTSRTPSRAKPNGRESAVSIRTFSTVLYTEGLGRQTEGGRSESGGMRPARCSWATRGKLKTKAWSPPLSVTGLAWQRWVGRKAVRGQRGARRTVDVARKRVLGRGHLTVSSPPPGHREGEHVRTLPGAGGRPGQGRGASRMPTSIRPLGGLQLRVADGRFTDPDVPWAVVARYRALGPQACRCHVDAATRRETEAKGNAKCGGQSHE